MVLVSGVRSLRPVPPPQPWAPPLLPAALAALQRCVNHIPITLNNTFASFTLAVPLPAALGPGLLRAALAVRRMEAEHAPRDIRGDALLRYS